MMTMPEVVDWLSDRLMPQEQTTVWVALNLFLQRDRPSEVPYRMQPSKEFCVRVDLTAVPSVDGVEAARKWLEQMLPTMAAIKSGDTIAIQNGSNETIHVKAHAHLGPPHCRYVCQLKAVGVSLFASQESWPEVFECLQEQIHDADLALKRMATEVAVWSKLYGSVDQPPE